MVNEAKQHLTLFFDFLEGHGLITPAEQVALSSFDAPPIIHEAAAVEQSHGGDGELPAEDEDDEEDEEDDTTRGAEVEKALKEWTAECEGKFKSPAEPPSTRRRLMGPVESSMEQTCPVEQVGVVRGWFEVYRVRGNYCLLKERELGESFTSLSLLCSGSFPLTAPPDSRRRGNQPPPLAL